MNDAPLFDPWRALDVLNQHEVRYLVVGGLGAILHGSAHTTEDLDVLADCDPENLQRLADALEALDARLRVAGMSDDETRLLPILLDARMLANAATWTLATNAGALDILSFLKTIRGAELSYHGLRDAAVIADTGIGPVLVASLDHIIEAKTFAGRPKDLAVLPELHELLGSKSRSGHAPQSLIELRFTRALETAIA